MLKYFASSGRLFVCVCVLINVFHFQLEITFSLFIINFCCVLLCWRWREGGRKKEEGRRKRKSFIHILLLRMTWFDKVVKCWVFPFWYLKSWSKTCFSKLYIWFTKILTLTHQIWILSSNIDIELCNETRWENIAIDHYVCSTNLRKIKLKNNKNKKIKCK